VGVEADLHVERLGQLAFLQAVQAIEAVVKLVQGGAPGFIGEQLTQGTVECGQALTGVLVSGVDAFCQVGLVVAQQRLNTVTVAAVPQQFGTGQCGALVGQLSSKQKCMARLSSDA
jgi:hypothetical protein